MRLVVFFMLSTPLLAQEQAPPKRTPEVTCAFRTLLESPEGRIASVTSILDRDGDGVDDFAVLRTQPHQVDFVSSQTGRIIQSQALGPFETTSWFVVRITPARDIDHDGLEDLVEYGWYRGKNDEWTACLQAVTSHGGVEPLRTLLEPGPTASFPNRFAISRAKGGDQLFLTRTFVSKDSGRTHSRGQVARIDDWKGAPSLTYSSPLLDDDFGSSLVVLDDRDGDGTPDIAIGAPGPFERDLPGGVQILSGKSLALLEPLEPSKLGIRSERFGIVLAAGADFDGDGLQDLLVGGSKMDSPVWLLSGRPMRVTRTFENPRPDDSNFASFLSPLCDMDGDHTPDVMVALSMAKRGELAEAGCAYLYSGATGKLISEVAVPVPAQSDRFGSLGAVVCPRAGKVVLVAGSERKLWYVVVTTDAQ